MTKQTPMMRHADDTDTQKQVASLIASILHETETNENKIQFIKEELTANRYQINSQQIAAKLLENAPAVKEVEMV